MKTELLAVFVVIVFICGSAMVVSGETQTSVWREEMNYQSLDQLKAGGWTVTHEEGVSFSGDAIILDGNSQDTAIHYSQHFSSGISDWKVEDKSRWISGSHCGNIVTAITDKHSYSFMVDGWYGNFAFYRDGQKTTFGSSQENKNTWYTLSIEKRGNQINMYYNGEVKSTYTETDTLASQLVGVDAVSPWKGGAEYDYFEVWQIGDTNTQEAQQSLLSNPIVIGGIIGAVAVGVGGALYFFVFTGSPGSAGGTSGSGSSGGSGGVGSGSGCEENPMLHPSGGTLTHPSGSGSSTLQCSTPSTLHNTQPSTLNEVALNDTVPNKFSQAELDRFNYDTWQGPSDNQAMQTNKFQLQGEQNQANTDRLRLQQQLQDQVIKPQQQIQNNKINTQNKINQQTNQLLQGSSGEVADSGGSGSES